MGIREDVYYDGGPHVGDLILNCLIGLSLVGLPLTIGAIVRAIWLRFRITSRRISVTGGWLGRDRSEIVYKEITKVVAVARMLGLWGDMVITLRDGSRLELRSVPNYREAYQYIQDRISAEAQTASRTLRV